MADLPERVFGVRWNAALVKQVYDGERANSRRPWAHAKDRSEVRGGGKKPWRQKGLGRARHGSTRSPIWVGGGVTHGPRKTRDFSVVLNKKMKTAAVRTVLSRKFHEGELIILDKFVLGRPKTKLAAEIIIFFARRDVAAKQPTTLLTLSRNIDTMRAVRNLQSVHCTEPRNLNTTILLHHKLLITDINSLNELVKVFG